MMPSVINKLAIVDYLYQGDILTIRYIGVNVPGSKDLQYLELIKLNYGFNIIPMTPTDKSKLLAWTTRLVALRAAAKGTTLYEEALALKAELMERAERRQIQVMSEKKPDKLLPRDEESLPSN